MKILRWLIGRDAYNSMITRRIQKRVSDHITGDCLVVYAVGSDDLNGMVSDNLDEVAYRGKVRIIDEIWDSYASGLLEDPTWLDLAVEANRMIIAVDDRHHVFLEGYERLAHQPEPEVMHLSLDLNS